jgi:hypothetical protein
MGNMDKWIALKPGDFFTIDGQVFKKNSPMTAMHITNSILGELYINPTQAAKIMPYTATPMTPKVKDPEKFETKITERPKLDPTFGATTVTVKPADSVIEQGIQPHPDTGKYNPTASKVVPQLVDPATPAKPPVTNSVKPLNDLPVGVWDQSIPSKTAAVDVNLDVFGPMHDGGSPPVPVKRRLKKTFGLGPKIQFTKGGK